MITIVDHNYHAWKAKQVIDNGAATYSHDLHAFQATTFEHADAIISTCPKFSDIITEKPYYHTAIQYLHCYPYRNPMGLIREIITGASFRYKQMIFVTAYSSFCQLIRNEGFQCYYVPMSIDTHVVRQYNKPGPRITNRLIYFGNIYSGKSELYSKVRKVAKNMGLPMDTISMGLFNFNTSLTQREAWEKISSYKFGIGVGRCALEMYTLGLKVLVCGAKFGGLVMNETDAQVQEGTNYNGRVTTFDRSIAACISCLPNSYIPYVPCIRSVSHRLLINL